MSEPMQIDKRADQYVRMRDKIKAIKDKHTAELKPFAEALETLGNLLLAELDTVGADSIRTTGGTVGKTLDSTASIADKSAFWTWVVTQGAWDFLDYKANVTAVADHIAQQTELALLDPNIVPAAPPGVNFSQRYKISVRRPTKTTSKSDT